MGAMKESEPCINFLKWPGNSGAYICGKEKLWIEEELTHLFIEQHYFNSAGFFGHRFVDESF